MMTLMTAIFIFIFLMTLAFAVGISAYLSFYKLENKNKFVKGTVFVANSIVLTFGMLLFETFVLWP